MATPSGSSLDATYSMNAVTRMTGLTPDTIRVWERRYSAVAPVRTEGGARRYSVEDVRRLALMKEASDRGHALAELARMDLTHLEQLVRGAQPSAGGSQASLQTMSTLLNDYMGLIERFRIFEANRMLARAAAVMETSEFVRDVVVPLLTEVGIRWQSGRLMVVHEHIISDQVRQLLHGIQYRREMAPGAPMVLVATPEQHRHEFGAVIGTYVAAAQGLRSIYLGSEVPWTDLCKAAESLQASLVVLSVVRKPEPDELEAMRTGLALLSNQVPVWVGAPRDLPELVLPNVRFFRSFEEFDVALATLRN